METQDVKKATESDGSNPLTIRVINNGHELFFKVKPTTQFQKIFDAYQQRTGTTARYLYNGVRVGPQDTPKELDMEDGDVIDAMVEQTGGGGSV